MNAKTRTAPHRCLSIRHPWAEWIVAGIKTIENRTWYTHHRGELLIHAGASVAELRRLERDGAIGPLPERSGLAFRAIIGRVRVVDCLSVQEYRDRHGDDSFAVGPWCFVLADAERFDTAIHYSGRLNLFPVPRARLRAATVAGRPIDPWRAGRQTVRGVSIRRARDGA